VDGNFWTSLGGIYYTPNWVVRTVDLSAYIGNCITVEVSAIWCTYGVHQGYVYYDALCANASANPNLIYINNASVTSQTACAFSTAHSPLPVATILTPGRARREAAFLEAHSQRSHHPFRELIP